MKFLYSVLFTFVFNLTCSAQKDTAFIVGNVKITAPNTFNKSDQFPGLLHKPTLSSILITEVKNSYLLVNAAQTDENFKSQGLEIVSKDTVVVDSQDVFLYHFKFNPGGMKFERIMMIKGNSENTMVIMANYPELVKVQMEAILRKTLLTAHF